MTQLKKAQIGNRQIFLIMHIFVYKTIRHCIFHLLLITRDKMKVSTILFNNYTLINIIVNRKKLPEHVFKSLKSE